MFSDIFFFTIPLLLISTNLLILLSHANLSDGQKLPDSEAETLLNIMESISSDQSWKISYPHPCQPDSSWPGLECKPSKDTKLLHVSRLDFGNPPFPTCKETATFPSLIFSLPFLQSVFFFNCFTLTKTNLSFPKDYSLFNSSSLQQLSLRSNPALTGQIPPQISHLKSLKILTLSQNQLSGTVPDEVFDLTTLVHLDLSYNFLNGSVSNQLGNLNSLVGLDLSYNRLSGSIPATIGQLGLLQKLDLSSNLLTGGIPDTIGKLRLLVFMALSNNQLSEEIPKGIEGLESLQYFIMDDNPMSMPLQIELGKLVRLQELRLGDSGYTGKIPQSFSQLRNLSTLSLQNNHLTGEIPILFGDFTHIYHLNLSRNYLSGTVPFNSSFLSRLGRNLDLSENPGLCLSSSEAFSVKIGVSVCGRNKSGLNQSLEDSQASFGLSCQFFVISTFGVLALHQMLFMM